MGEKEAGEITSTVTLERERYEEMLLELGELRKLKEFIEQYRIDLFAKDVQLKEKDRELEEVKEILLETEWKDYELEQTQKRIRELELEIAYMKTSRPWWKKVLRL
jgi:uncharacterized protein YPO0396